MHMVNQHWMLSLGNWLNFGLRYDSLPLSYPMILLLLHQYNVSNSLQIYGPSWLRRQTVYNNKCMQFGWKSRRNLRLFYRRQNKWLWKGISFSLPFMTRLGNTTKFLQWSMIRLVYWKEGIISLRSWESKFRIWMWRKGHNRSHCETI
jgi:hypothetical protein